MLENRLKQSPGDGTYIYLLAETYAELGDKEKALGYLAQISDRGMGFYPDALSALAKFSADPEYLRLLKQIDDREPKISNATPAGFIRATDLVPEGIAYHQPSKRIFIGSMYRRKIYEARLGSKPDSPAREFAEVELTPLGMTVDIRRNLLWVATTNALGGEADPKMQRGEVLSFDLRTRKLVTRYTHPDGLGYNDLAVALNGDIYVTDSAQGTVFCIEGRTGMMRPVLPLKSLNYPNGIAISPDGKQLFVAQGAGIVVVDLATKEFKRPHQPANVTTLGVDGMYWHNGSLVAVQNGISAGRVVRFRLNQARDAITGAEVLEARNPSFNIPTTGALAGDTLYVLANSHLRNLEGGEIKDRAELKMPVILKLKLLAAPSKFPRSRSEQTLF